MDISNKLDKELIERYTEVALVMAELNVPFFVVEMDERGRADPDFNFALLDAFKNGLLA